MRKRVFAVVVASAVLAATALSGVAYAVSTYRTGGPVVRQHISTSTDPWMAPGPNTWQTIPATSITVVVLPGTRRLITARFGAESQCLGAGWCSVRIVYTSIATPPTELAPQSGTDYAFDSPGGTWEQHSVERTTAVYLPAGVYRVSAQAQRVNATAFRLDDYHFNVSTIAP